MILLAQRLSAAGLSFVAATARSRHGTILSGQVVVATEAERQPMVDWAARERLPLTVRVATADERRQAEGW